MHGQQNKKTFRTDVGPVQNMSPPTKIKSFMNLIEAWFKRMRFSAARFPHVAYLHMQTHESMFDMKEMLRQKQYSDRMNSSRPTIIGLHPKLNGMYVLPLLLLRAVRAAYT
jgi:hypothetical protein